MNAMPSRTEDTFASANERHEAAKKASAQAFAAYRDHCDAHGDSNPQAATLWQTWSDAIGWQSRTSDRLLGLVLDARNRGY